MTLCINCGEELPEYDITMVVYCDACRMRNDQLIENWHRELKLFGELRRKIREGRKPTDIAGAPFRESVKKKKR